MLDGLQVMSEGSRVARDEQRILTMVADGYQSVVEIVVDIRILDWLFAKIWVDSGCGCAMRSPNDDSPKSRKES